MNFKKPIKLKSGDRVAIVSPSWGGPSVFPKVYESGLKILRKWGLEIIEYPTTKMEAKILRDNPKLRAKDINDAFSNPEIKAIISSIGGDDSIRILPYLDKKIISNNPKILMGYSDTTTLHVFCNMQRIVTFYGPSIMAGFSQMKSLPKYFESHVKEILFEFRENYEYKAYERYCDGYPDWTKSENIGKINPLKDNNGWQWLQGSTVIQGEFFGGCVEVLEMMKATDFWPSKEFWKGKVFFLETSEEKPPVRYISHVLRNYGMIGVFDQINGFVFSRARDSSDQEKKDLEEIILSVVSKEFKKTDLPIVTNFDIGHTDPQLVLPLGVMAEIDCRAKKISLIEPWFSENMNF